MIEFLLHGGLSHHPEPPDDNHMLGLSSGLLISRPAYGAPPDPAVFGWGGADPPLKRSFVTFDRGGQTGPPRSNDFFFGAADDTRAARTSARTFGRTPGVVWLSPV